MRSSTLLLFSSNVFLLAALSQGQIQPQYPLDLNEVKSAQMLEFRSLVKQVEEKEELEKELISSIRLEDIQRLRNLLKNRIGVRNRTESKPTIVQEQFVDEAGRVGGKDIRYREILFDLSGHEFIVHELTPLGKDGSPLKELPVYIFLCGQTQVAAEYVTIPGVSFIHSLEFDNSANINGTLGFALAAKKLATVYVPTYILDTSYRIALNRLLLLKGSSLAAVEFEKNRAVLDYALSQDYVRKDRTLVSGVSMGAQNALIFAALDGRIDGVILSSWAPDLSNDGVLGLFGRERLSAIVPDALYLPGLFELGDANLLYRLLAPRPVLIVAGREDALYTVQESFRTFQKMKEYYSGLGVSQELLSFVVSNLGHTVDSNALLPWIQDFIESGRSMRTDSNYRPDAGTILGFGTLHLTDMVKNADLLTSPTIQRANVVVDTTAYPSILLHAPSSYTWNLLLDLNRKHHLKMKYGIIENMRNATNDGVEFVVLLRTDGQERELLHDTVDPVHDTDDRTYKDLDVDLSVYAGKTVELTVVSKERADNIGDHFYLIDPRIESSYR